VGPRAGGRAHSLVTVLTELPQITSKQRTVYGFRSLKNTALLDTLIVL
jgi:hypothetical protein